MSFVPLTERTSLCVEIGHGDLFVAVCFIPCTLGLSLCCWALTEGIEKITWRYHHQGKQRSQSWSSDKGRAWTEG